MTLLPTPAARDWRSGESNVMDRNARPLNEVIVNLLPTQNQWGPYELAVARWGQLTGQAAPSPTEPGSKGQPRLNPRFVEWLMGLPSGWVTDHLGRNASLRCLGNGVVWQQAATAYADLLGAS